MLYIVVINFYIKSKVVSFSNIKVEVTKNYD